MDLDGWQQDVLEDALAVRDDGKWAAFEVGVIVPRQNGKGAILEALELHALFREPECRLILHSAHEFKTAKEAFRRVVGLIDANPKLKKRATVRYTTGEEGVELDDGSRLKFVARSSGSGRGFSGDLVILDEAYNLSDDMMAALLPTMSARPNPQLWYTSSAPLPRSESEVLRRLCRRGRDGSSPGLAYFEWCAPAGASLTDRDNWGKANPGLNIRISPEFIERELVALDNESFARERLGIWSEVEDGRVISPGSWEKCLDPASKRAGAVTFAFDVSPDRSVSSIGAAALSDGTAFTHIEVVENARGTGWVIPRLVELNERWDVAAIVCDPGSPAGGLLSQAQAAGLDITEASTREVTQACGGFLDGVLNGEIRHVGQYQLDDAVAGAMKRDIGDAWGWSRKNSAVDISPLVAVTLAKWAWENAGPSEAGASVW